MYSTFCNSEGFFSFITLKLSLYPDFSDKTQLLQPEL